MQCSISDAPLDKDIALIPIIQALVKLVLVFYSRVFVLHHDIHPVKQAIEQFRKLVSRYLKNDDLSSLCMSLMSLNDPSRLWYVVGLPLHATQIMLHPFIILEECLSDKVTYFRLNATKYGRQETWLSEKTMHRSRISLQDQFLRNPRNGSFSANSFNSITAFEVIFYGFGAALRRGISFSKWNAIRIPLLHNMIHYWII